MQLNSYFLPSLVTANARTPSNSNEEMVADFAPVPPVGFSAATPIETPDGLMCISALAVGDTVVTLNGTLARIEAIDCVHLTAQDLHNRPSDAPIRFDPMAVPGMMNETAVLLSGGLPVHIPVQPDGTCMMHRSGGTSQFPARAYCDGGLIRRVIPEDGVTYINLHLDGTHQICAAGIWVEVDASGPVTPKTAIPIQRPASGTCEFRPMR